MHFLKAFLHFKSEAPEPTVPVPVLQIPAPHINDQLRLYNTAFIHSRTNYVKTTFVVFLSHDNLFLLNNCVLQPGANNGTNRTGTLTTKVYFYCLLSVYVVNVGRNL